MALKENWWIYECVVMSITLCVTCTKSSFVVASLGYVPIVMSMRMVMLVLCVVAAINEILRTDDPYLYTPMWMHELQK